MVASSRIFRFVEISSCQINLSKSSRVVLDKSARGRQQCVVKVSDYQSKGKVNRMCILLALSLKIEIDDLYL